MTGLLVLEIDRDTAGHLAVALRRHRGRLAELGGAEPPGLADLETLAVRVYEGHEGSRRISVPASVDDDLDARDFLTRRDICRLAGVSLSTVKRWLQSGDLPSTQHGRIRRVARVDLDRFLSAA